LVDHYFSEFARHDSIDMEIWSTTSDISSSVAFGLSQSRRASSAADVFGVGFELDAAQSEALDRHFETITSPTPREARDRRQRLRKAAGFFKRLG